MNTQFPNHSQDAATSYYDERKFQRYTDGNAGERAAIVTAFLVHTPVTLAELEQSLESGLAKKTSKLIHQIKSSIGLLCTDTLYNEIVEVEKSSVLIGMPEYLSQCRLLISKITALLNELRPYASSSALITLKI